jgi:hypothetical protein
MQAPWRSIRAGWAGLGRWGRAALVLAGLVLACALAGALAWHTLDGRALLRRPALQRWVAAWVVPPAQAERLKIYHEALRTTLMPLRGPQDLGVVLTPMFALAQQRTAAGGDAAAENRAALMALAAHAVERHPGAWLAAARTWPRVPARGLRLDGRKDFPIHLLVSATLAAEGGGPLADALGLLKEVDDAEHGSGFSFNDIAVNRAGARLGELAVHEPIRLQTALARPVTARDLVPDVSDLPEFMSEAEFVARFGGVGAAPYRAQVAEIEARVRAMPLYR